uniref:Uncharacterized protein n=1 Tax=Arundo donax TaxID=35708 RepID=A0A0A9GRJ3_ARUDO
MVDHKVASTHTVSHSGRH